MWQRCENGAPPVNSYMIELTGEDDRRVLEGCRTVRFDLAQNSSLVVETPKGETETEEHDTKTRSPDNGIGDCLSSGLNF